MLNGFIKRGVKFILNNLAPTTKVYPQIISLAPNCLLKGRTALITGGTSGIGYEIAKAFLDAGANVIITGRNKERIDVSIAQLKNTIQSKSEVNGIVLNNLKVSDFKNRFAEALKIANAPIDILVNNAGVLGCDFSNGNEEEYDAVLDTNLKGVFFLSQLVAHYMKDHHIKGNILNVASSSSLRPAASAYTLSKWGIRGLTQGMARTLTQYDIVVNGIAPGPTATPMLMREGVSKDISLKQSMTGRYALPEEIANMAVILVSDMSRMVVGDIVYMTGGAGLITNDDITYAFD